MSKPDFTVGGSVRHKKFELDGTERIAFQLVEKVLRRFKRVVGKDHFIAMMILFSDKRGGVFEIDDMLHSVSQIEERHLLTVFKKATAAILHERNEGT
jgi:hypothetical protein